MKKLEQKVRKIIESLGHTNTLDYTTRYTVWTRGDGAKYKDMDSFRVRELDAQDIFEHIESHANRFVWISGEFTSMPKRKAVIYNGIVFIMSDGTIEVASKSILRNLLVWKIQARDVRTKQIADTLALIK
jgi:hypothetical protein